MSQRSKSPKPPGPPKFEVVNKKSDHREVAKWLSDNGTGKDFMVILGDPKTKTFAVRSNIGVQQGVPLLLNMVNDMFEYVQHETGRLIAQLDRRARKGLR